MTNNLVYTCVGDCSAVSKWLSPNRKFDVWMVYYGDTEFGQKNLVDYYLRRKGSKFQNLKYLTEKRYDQLAIYDAIFVIDDDIAISSEQIEKLFQIRADYNLTVLQPAFLATGKISHPPTAVFPGAFGRYTNFVEVTCPLFHTPDLLDFMTVYDGSL